MENNLKEAYAKAELLVRKPVEEVFAAFVNPDITTKFWFTKSSGLLAKDAQVVWTWEMYQVSVEVTVKELVPGQSIIINWGNSGQTSRVSWTFEPHGQEATFVSIVNDGFAGDADQQLAEVRNSTEGFTLVLAGLKAYLEHGIQLNLIADRFPKPPAH